MALILPLRIEEDWADKLVLNYASIANRRVMLGVALTPERAIEVLIEDLVIVGEFESVKCCPGYGLNPHLHLIHRGRSSSGFSQRCAEHPDRRSGERRKK